MSWWESLYDELLAEVLLTRDDPAGTEATLAFLTEHLALAPGDRVLDQCCGIGSLSVPLAVRGLHVVAIDQCAGYVDRARRAARDAGVELEATCADAFAYVPAVPCDAAFNWWTSFGYADDDACNVRMLARAFEALRPGGRFALDVMNLPGVLRGFQRDTVVRRQTERGEIVLLRESRLDLAGGALDKVWTYFLPDGRRVSHRSRVRLHLPHTVAEMLAGCGFVDVALYGSPLGEPLALDSPRCILTARRPS